MSPTQQTGQLIDIIGNFIMWLRTIFNLTLTMHLYNIIFVNFLPSNLFMRIHKPILHEGKVTIPASHLLANDSGVHRKISEASQEILGHELSTDKHKGGVIAFLSVKQAAMLLHNIYLDVTSPLHHKIKRKPKPFYIKDKTATYGPAAAHIPATVNLAKQRQQEMTVQLTEDVKELKFLLDQFKQLQQLGDDLHKTADLVNKLNKLREEQDDLHSFFKKLQDNELTYPTSYANVIDNIKILARQLHQKTSNLGSIFELAEIIDLFNKNEIFEIHTTLEQQYQEKNQEVEHPSLITPVALNYPFNHFKFLLSIKALKITSFEILEDQNKIKISLTHSDTDPSHNTDTTKTVAIVDFNTINKLPSEKEIKDYFSKPTNRNLDCAWVNIKNEDLTDYFVLGENEKVSVFAKEIAKGKSASSQIKTNTFAYIADVDPFLEAELQPKRRAKTPRDATKRKEQLRAMSALKWHTSTLNISAGSMVKLLTSTVGIGKVILRHIKLLREFNKKLTESHEAPIKKELPKPSAPVSRAQRPSLVLEQLRSDRLAARAPIAGIHGFTCAYTPDYSDEIVQYIQTDDYLTLQNKPAKCFPMIDDNTKIAVVIAPPIQIKTSGPEKTGEPSTPTTANNDEFVYLTLTGRDSILTFILILKLANYSMHLNSIWKAQVKRLNAHINRAERIKDINVYTELGVITLEQAQELKQTISDNPKHTSSVTLSISDHSRSSSEHSSPNSSSNSTPLPVTFFTPTSAEEQTMNDSLELDSESTSRKSKGKKSAGSYCNLL